MNKTFFLPLILLFFIIYFLVFPFGSGEEVFWTAADLFDYNDPNSAPLNLDRPLIVNQGRYRGVLEGIPGASTMESGGGRRAYSVTHRYRKSGSTFLIEDLKTRGVMSLSLPGNPLVLKDHIYAVDFGSAFIEEIDDAGRSLWRWQGVSPVTAITAGEGVTVFGSIDGMVRLFDTSGHMTELDMKTGNPDQIIYGLALSGDGGSLAVVSGLNDQFVRQFRLSEGEPPELLYESRLDDRFRGPVKLLYSHDGTSLWVEQDKTIRQYYRDGIGQIIPLEGQFLTHMLDEEEGIYYILCRQTTNGDTGYLLTAYSLNGSVLMRNSFREYPGFLAHSGSELFFSMDGMMAVLKRVES